MKTILPILALVATIGAFVYASSTQPLLTTEVVMLSDYTDTVATQATPDEVFSVYKLQDNPNNGARFRLTSITDMDYNATREFSLRAVQPLASNQLERPKEVAAFTQEVTTALVQAAHKTSGRRHSSVYAPLARALNTLSQSRSGRRVLLVYSDLMENTDIRFYNADTLALVKNNPAVIERMLEKQVPLGNLSDIEVHLIYEPATYQANKNFVVVSNFYKRLLESKGATVIIEANLNEN